MLLLPKQKFEKKRENNNNLVHQKSCPRHGLGIEVSAKMEPSSLESASSLETACGGAQTRYKNSALFTSQQGFFILHGYWVLARWS